jgi:hypothetical protein
LNFSTLNLSTLKKTIVFLLLAAVGLAFVAPRDEILSRLLERLADYQETYAPEKVYLHLSKTHFFAGDDLWFKAYVVEAATHRPDSGSGVLYVELLDAKGMAVVSEKIRLAGGTGSGTLPLPEDLPTARYRLRAYTRWMQNEGAERFFTQEITVANVAETAVAATGTEETAKVQFFPEGGEWVAGLPSRVGFKATDRNGLGVDAQLTVVSNAGDTVGTFASLHRGMGTFVLTPETGKTYRASVRTASGRTATFDLPAAKTQGWAMAVENTPTAVQVTVRSNGNAREKIHLVAQTRGKAVFQQAGEITENSFTTSIPTEQVPTGVAQITVFDGNGTPRCERLVFVNRNDQIRLQITPDKAAYQPREKVTLNVTARDANGSPVAGDFSLAVSDAALYESPTQTILTNLLLTSDLRGTVEDPAYYFREKTPQTAAALDALLLTQGWRRFVWREAPPAEPTFDREKDISLTVRLLDKASGQPLPAKILLISAPGTQSVFRYGYTDQKGYITLGGLDFNDYRNVFVGIHDIELTNTARVVADTVPRPPAAAQPMQPAVRNLVPSMEKRKAWAVVRSRFAAAEGPVAVVSVADSVRPVSPIYKKADDVIKLDDYLLFPTMEEVIRDIVPWGLLTHRKDKTGFRVLNFETKMYFKRSPLFLIDNAPVRSIDPVLTLDPAAVHTIECVRSSVGRGQFGEIGFNGIFSVFTKAGDYYPSNEPGLFVFPVRGYQAVREFYMPDHTNPARNRRQPDFRDLLYWNPSVRTDANGQATVTFHASDDLTTWQIVAEGISETGKVGVSEAKFTVAMPPVR